MMSGIIVIIIIIMITIMIMIITTEQPIPIFPHMFSYTTPKHAHKIEMISQ